MGKHKVIICLFTVNLLFWGLVSEKGGQQKSDLHLDLCWGFVYWFFFFFLARGRKNLLGHEDNFLINNFCKTVTYITDHSQICLHKQSIYATRCQVMFS